MVLYHRKYRRLDFYHYNSTNCNRTITTPKYTDSCHFVHLRRQWAHLQAGVYPYFPRCPWSVTYKAEPALPTRAAHAIRPVLPLFVSSSPRTYCRSRTLGPRIRLPAVRPRSTAAAADRCAWPCSGLMVVRCGSKPRPLAGAGAGFRPTKVSLFR